MEKQKTVLITGVSSGIGKGIAKAFINKGYKVFGSVRNKADADSMKNKLGNSYHPLVFDVTKQAEIAAARDEVKLVLDGQLLDCLINNAGMAVAGPLMHQSIEVIKSHFDVNVLGVLNVTQAFLPLLGATGNIKSKPDRIINISSVGGKIAGPFIGAYHGTKFALEGISHTLRRELLLYGIDVIIVGPGSVDTPIWDKGVDTNTYKNTGYFNALVNFMNYFIAEGKKGFSIDYIGEELVKIAEKVKPKTRYALVPGIVNNWIIPRLLPDRMLDRMIGRNLGFTK